MATLLELLVEHLEEWPDETYCIEQSKAGLHYTIGSWSAFFSDYSGVLPLASDYQTAIITREMWEEAKK